MIYEPIHLSTRKVSMGTRKFQEVISEVCFIVETTGLVITDIEPDGGVVHFGIRGTDAQRCISYSVCYDVLYLNYDSLTPEQIQSAKEMTETFHIRIENSPYKVSVDDDNT